MSQRELVTGTPPSRSGASVSTVVLPSVITCSRICARFSANPWMCAAMSNTGEDSSNSTYLPLRHHSRNERSRLKATSTRCRLTVVGGVAFV